MKKPTFRKAVKGQRCLVPATGFYEWQMQQGKKVPQYIFNPKDKYLALAGLYDDWKDPKSGKTLRTFTIITTAPNNFMSPIHNRMPLVLAPDQEELWLDISVDEEAVKNILADTPHVSLAAYEVSTAVNSPQNDYPSLINPYHQDMAATNPVSLA